MFLDENPGLVGVGERGGAGRGEDGEGEAGEGDCRSHLRGSDQVFFYSCKFEIRPFLFKSFKHQFPSYFLPIKTLLYWIKFIPKQKRLNI